jgi:hypothetical protein
MRRAAAREGLSMSKREMHFSISVGVVFAAIAVVAFQGCGGDPSSAEGSGKLQQGVTLAAAATLPLSDPLPCGAWSYAAVANSSNIILNAATIIDSYQSSLGAYGGSNTGGNAIVQAATTITTNGGTVHGSLRANTGSGFGIVPVRAGALNLPLGSSTPGALNINNANQSITLSPGDYVAANINVNFPGAINVSPAGQVRIWVTGTLNLGGNENSNGVPRNLAFLVTSSGTVNVNSGGSLYGMVYAPTSVVNVNSKIFGSVIAKGLSVVNSGGAIHFDSASTCTQLGATPTPAGPSPLPAPPADPGCYIGTANGWLSVPCKDPSAYLHNFKRFDVSKDGLVASAVGATPVPKLVFGQVETTVTKIASELDDSAPNYPGWSIQANTNGFSCGTGANCIVQFVTCADGVYGNTAVCIESWQYPAGGALPLITNRCVGADGLPFDGGLGFRVTTRKGQLQPGDFANVAGYTYTTNGQPMVGMVSQFSWVADQDVVPSSETALPNRIPGLYSVVVPDSYGLAQGWNRVTGTLMGMENSSNAVFSQAEVLTRVATSNCAGDVSASGPTCPTASALAANDVQFTTSGGYIYTVETNNLTSTVASPDVTFPNRNLAVTSFLSTTNTPTGSTTGACLPGEQSHLYMRDNEGDTGGTPSNVGGVPFWESPDIFVVPQGAPNPTVFDTPADVQVTAGQQYNVWLRVHNEFGCDSVKSPVTVFIDGADPDMGFANWSAVTPGADLGNYITFNGTNPIAPAYGVGMIGPFPWKPTGTGHKCLLASISAGNELIPPASASAPVLPPAYSWNQIAQRNLQIGSTCAYNITMPSSGSANLLLGISVTPATPAPGAAGGPLISLVIGDPGGVWSAEWQGVPGATVSSDGTNTTVVLTSGHVALPSVFLDHSPTVTINATSPGTAPTVDVSAMLTEPYTGSILLLNGGSCVGTQVISEGG